MNLWQDLPRHMCGFANQVLNLRDGYPAKGEALPAVPLTNAGQAASSQTRLTTRQIQLGLTMCVSW
jgi:hypothetical protein